MLSVTCGGRGIPRARYSCRIGNTMYGIAPCTTFGVARPDDVIAKQILVAAQPLAGEAVFVAVRQVDHELDERRRTLALERQQPEYEVELARRRYEKVDPENRLVAAELEARWNAALQRLRESEARLADSEVSRAPAVSGES